MFFIAPVMPLQLVVRPPFEDAIDLVQCLFGMDDVGEQPLVAAGEAAQPFVCCSMSSHV